VRLFSTRPQPFASSRTPWILHPRVYKGYSSSSSVFCCRSLDCPCALPTRLDLTCVPHVYVQPILFGFDLPCDLSNAPAARHNSNSLVGQSFVLMRPRLVCKPRQWPIARSCSALFSNDNCIDRLDSAQLCFELWFLCPHFCHANRRLGSLVLS
jgi:hypothetical protein